jgi:hypothetical protein
VLAHPGVDGWISLDRTGEPQKLAHNDFISTLGGLLNLITEFHRVTLCMT